MPTPSEHTTTQIILPIDIDPDVALSALKDHGVEAQAVDYAADETTEVQSGRVGVIVDDKHLDKTREILSELGQKDFNELRVVQHSFRTETNWYVLGLFISLVMLGFYLAWRAVKAIIRR